MNVRLAVKLLRKPEPTDPGRWVYPLVSAVVLILVLANL